MEEGKEGEKGRSRMTRRKVRSGTYFKMKKLRRRYMEEDTPNHFPGQHFRLISDILRKIEHPAKVAFFGIQDSISAFYTPPPHQHLR